jgi:hypothetical protein
MQASIRWLVTGSWWKEKEGVKGERLAKTSADSWSMNTAGSKT